MVLWYVCIIGHILIHLYLYTIKTFEQGIEQLTSRHMSHFFELIRVEDFE